MSCCGKQQIIRVDRANVVATRPKVVQTISRKAVPVVKIRPANDRDKYRV